MSIGAQILDADPPAQGVNIASRMTPGFCRTSTRPEIEIRLPSFDDIAGISHIDPGGPLPEISLRAPDHWDRGSRVRRALTAF